jgi:hypothetical protein
VSRARRCSLRSRGRPRRGIGNLGCGCWDGSSFSSSVIGAYHPRGATELTVIPWRPSSSASCLVSPPSPYFATAYAPPDEIGGVLVDGRDVDDPSAAALLRHPGSPTLGAQERAVEIDGKRVPPVVVGEFGARGGAWECRRARQQRRGQNPIDPRWKLDNAGNVVQSANDSCVLPRSRRWTSPARKH